MTAHKFVVGERKATHSPRNFAYLIRTLEDRPLIVDSGMFTIQAQVWPAGGWIDTRTLGATYKSSDWMRRYIDRYVALLKAVDHRGLVVECDCHLLTADWERDLEYARALLRREFGDRVIHVWHPSCDGPLAETAAKFGRVGISDPAMKSATGRRADLNIHAAIRAARVTPAHHVHVLGTSNFDSYARYPDNFSCDSSSWSMIVRFGRAFPRTLFPVEWYRRKELRAPRGVLEEVDAGLERCLRAAASTPLNTARARKPEYLRALAAAMVAGNRLHASNSAKYDHPASEVVTGVNPRWLSQRDATQAAASPSTSATRRVTTSAGSATRRSRG